ncbi:hypothetical protein [Flavobacterium gelatinilyticum]|uniref:hypothetical protein n=1 Tax=Flavobacterium gelatinilyticum TaxID=3003260 RepID=UPI0024813CDC|nr:hypothetical protein [Flavobacterium gelatinilyticum]
MKKLNAGVIIVQFLGMIILINGILQLKLYTVSEKVICIRNPFQNQKPHYCSTLFPTREAVLDFWPSVFIWIFFGLLIGIFFVGFLNWKRKLSSGNTILVAIALYLLLRLKFFRKEIFSHFFRPIREALSDDFGTQCLIEGIIFTVIGLCVLYYSVNSKYLHSKNDINDH